MLLPRLRPRQRPRHHLQAPRFLHRRQVSRSHTTTLSRLSKTSLSQTLASPLFNRQTMAGCLTCCGTGRMSCEVHMELDAETRTGQKTCITFCKPQTFSMQSFTAPRQPTPRFPHQLHLYRPSLRKT